MKHSLTTVNTITYLGNMLLKMLPLQELSEWKSRKTAMRGRRLPDLVGMQCVMLAGLVAPIQKRPLTYYWRNKKKSRTSAMKGSRANEESSGDGKVDFVKTISHDDKNDPLLGATELEYNSPKYQ